MATFGEVINLQPYILNWLVNGENEALAHREVYNESYAGEGFKKVTYRGKYQDFLSNYLLPLTKSTNVYSDRRPYFKNVNRGKLLSSLIEYKSRWNINSDSAALKIDYIGFKGDWLVIKTTEVATASVIFGYFNGTTSSLVNENLDLLDESNIWKYPFKVSATIRLTQEQYDNIVDNDLYVGIASTDQGVDNYLYFDLYGDSLAEELYLAFQIIPDAGVTLEVTQLIAPEDIINKEITIENELTKSGSDITLVCKINGVEVYTDTQTTAGASTTLDPYIVGWGMEIGMESSNLQGYLRNLILESGGETLINISDPSTGINTGTAGNAIVTDVIKVYL